MNNNGPKTYEIQRIESLKEWQKSAPVARISAFPWDAAAENTGFRPASCARVVYDDTSLFVYMETDETELRSETKGFGFVHTDSCMEFFLSPDPSRSGEYLNWEFNPAGAMYLSIGKGRHDRREAGKENYREFFKIKNAVHEKGWSLEYQIPLSFLRRFFPALELKPGCAMRGNFYKCGGKTARPHYGCWSPITLPEPDFHCPDFFGTVLLNRLTHKP